VSLRRAEAFEHSRVFVGRMLDPDTLCGEPVTDLPPGLDDRPGALKDARVGYDAKKCHERALRKRDRRRATQPIVGPCLGGVVLRHARCGGVDEKVRINKDHL
jgi:hypothetical protein